MRITLESAVLLSKRYLAIAQEQLKTASGERAEQLKLMVNTLNKVPANPCNSMYEAIQCYMLLWEIMCLEQAPNPFAFSVGNADRVFEPYRANDGLSREEAASLLKHFVVSCGIGNSGYILVYFIIGINIFY